MAADADSLLWIDPQGADWGERKTVVTAALESGFSVVLADRDDVAKVRKLADITVAGFAGDVDVDLARIDAGDTESPDTEAAYVEISSKQDEVAAAKLGASLRYLIVDNRDWRVIPLENLIAQLHTTDCALLARIADEKEARLVFETLEVGVSGIVLATGDPAVVKKVGDYARTRLSSEGVSLIPLTVTRVTQVGMGDRVCVDTCSMMAEGEGMLIGSASNGFFLVASESLDSEYVASRPFRVNAGAVHAYIKVPEGKTSYLSELKAGADVLVVSAKGEAKPACVGRVKIEKRPLLLVEAETAEGQAVQTILQNAETINLVDKDGNHVSVAHLKEGDEVLGAVEDAGRHFGMKVEETIVEK